MLCTTIIESHETSRESTEFSAWLTKPLGAVELTAKLAQWLASSPIVDCLANSCETNSVGNFAENCFERFGLLVNFNVPVLKQGIKRMAL